MPNIEEKVMLIEEIERVQQNKQELTLESFVGTGIASDDEEEE